MARLKPTNGNLQWLNDQRVSILADIGAYFVRNYDPEIRDGTTNAYIERLQIIEKNLEQYRE